IENLKLQDLNVTLTIDGAKSNDKLFADMQKQIETLQNKIKELNAQLGNIGKSPSRSGNTFIGVGKDLEQVQSQITKFLKDEGYKNFEFKINADVNDGQKTIKNFVATIKDADSEVRKLTFMPDGGSFKEIKETLSDNSVTQYNKTLNNISEAMLSVNRSGILGADSIEEFNRKITQINNSDITLDEKIAQLRNQLTLMNRQIDDTSFQNKLTKSMQDAEIAVRNLDSSLLKTTKTYKREASTMKNEINDLKKEITDLSKIPIFRTQRDIDEFNSRLKQTQSNLRQLNSEMTAANRSSITLVSAIKTAFER
ncbi:hypothetical protein D7X33_21405, partial [Butyricicoccus sp. 1XD8-22]